MQCLFCQSTEIKNASFPRPTFFNGKNFGYYQCRNCRLVFINPIPSDEDYAKMYAKSYHDQFYFKEESPDYSDFYNLVKRNTEDGTLVDYGCGDGSFLDFFSKRGFNCTGVEYDRELVSRLKRRFPSSGFYTVDEFHQISKEKKFGTIYLGDVLEHLSNPAQFISELRSKLSRKGLIMVQGPLENNFTAALAYRKFISRLRSGKPAAHVPYHISFSNAKNQESIFRNNGFSTVYYKIYETSWPFPGEFSWHPIEGFKWLIAKTSILWSKIFPGKMGNRFIYVGIMNNEK